MFPAEHASKGLARVGVPVKNVHFQVALLARRDVRAVGTVPSTESLHHNHVCESVLKQEKHEASSSLGVIGLDRVEIVT